MGFEEITTGKLPFLGTRYDISDPVGAVTAILTAVIALTIWHVADAVGANYANKVLAAVGAVLPSGNPASATDGSADSMVRGEL